METTALPSQTCRMTERTKQIIRDRAFDLACEAFGEPYDDVVEAIYERLAWNWLRGLGEAGVVTVH